MNIESLEFLLDDAILSKLLHLLPQIIIYSDIFFPFPSIRGRLVARRMLTLGALTKTNSSWYAAYRTENLCLRVPRMDPMHKLYKFAREAR